MTWLAPRAAGVLLHPTSLPGRFPCGDLGPGADRFLEWAVAAGMGFWQVLPLGPTGWGDSPYSGLSAFAGSPHLISPELLVADGLVDAAALPEMPDLERTDFGLSTRLRQPLLREAWRRFHGSASSEHRLEFEAFRDGEERLWLEDWVLFAALKAHHGGRAWVDWDADLRGRDPFKLDRARQELESELDFLRFEQFLFRAQWRRVREKAAGFGIRLLSDLPFYVAHDSVDVWSRQELFELDEHGRPTAVSGVPPDDFSSTGQRWGSPVYRWERHAEEGYSWWVRRLRAGLALADGLRLDHFRGFEAWWRVPADQETAATGEWRPGPGRGLFEPLQAAGESRLVAEDLGVITPEVEALRDALGMPGTRVLQFAFGELDSLHLPHRCPPAAVFYTGTHDNDTTRGWFETLGDEERRRVLDYSAARPETVHHDLLRLAYTSVAELAVAPLQDVLGLGGEARMNRPGAEAGNWGWRVTSEQLTAAPTEALRRLAELSGRVPGAESDAVV